MESRAVPKASKELDSAIEDDRKYKEVDSAKKRAVAQRVDYDTFKNLVSVAHLKPLQAPDEIVRGAPAWRFNALGLSEDKESGQKVASTSGADDGGYVATEQPKTSADFERTWKKMCRTNRDKYDYVKFCSAETLSKIFKVELSSTLLSSILEVLQDCFVATGEDKGDAENIFRSLRCLAKSGRFSLTVRLLGSKHKACLRDVVGRLKEALGEDAAEMQELLKDYGLNPS